MIIIRTPFRISFAGGGRDMASFYIRHEGCVLSASINKYIYIIAHPSFSDNSTTGKYGKTEIAYDVHKIQHPIVRLSRSVIIGDSAALSFICYRIVMTYFLFHSGFDGIYRIISNSASYCHGERFDE